MGCVLEADSGHVLDLEDTDAGFVLESVDIGLPDVREVVSNRPTLDGTLDYTALHSSRSVTLGLALVPGTIDKSRLLSLMAPFLRADARSTLRVATEKGGEFKRLRVRSAGSLSAPFERPNYIRIAAGFVSIGSPFFQSDDLHWRVTFPGIDVEGRPYDLVHPRVYPWSAPTEAPVINEGDQPSNWQAIFLGPVTNPSIVNITLGQGVYTHNSFRVAAGQTAIFDSATRTITADGENRYTYFDSSRSTWWLVPPGGSVVQPLGTGITVPTKDDIANSWCRFEWRDTYLF